MAALKRNRVFNKHGTEADWNKSTKFIPKFGEMIVYDPDEEHPYARLKMGNGVLLPKDLPFIDAGTVGGVDVNHIQVDRLKHKLTFGAGAAYTFDGSEDVTVPVYTGKTNP